MKNEHASPVVIFVVQYLCKKIFFFFQFEDSRLNIQIEGIYSRSQLGLLDYVASTVCELSVPFMLVNYGNKTITCASGIERVPIRYKKQTKYIMYHPKV